MKKKLFSMLLVLAMVLTMATSVSALREDHDAYDTIVPCGTGTAARDIATFEDVEAGTTYTNKGYPNHMQVGSGADISVVADGEEQGNVIRVGNGYTLADDGTKSYWGNGKYWAFPRVDLKLQLTNVRIDFDFKLEEGNSSISVMVARGDAVGDRTGIFSITSAGNIRAAGSETNLYNIGDGWNHFTVYLNTTTNLFTLYVGDTLVIHSRALSDAIGYFNSLVFYQAKSSAERSAFYIDNYGLKAKSVAEDLTIYNLPEYYPENMNHFETFNGLRYMSQSPTPGSTTDIRETIASGSEPGTVFRNSTDWYFSNSGNARGAEITPYVSGGSDKYFRYIGDVTGAHSYVSYNINGTTGITYKTINSQQVDDGSGNMVTEYLEPTYNEDARFLYFTFMLGGLHDFSNITNDVRFYVAPVYKDPSETSGFNYTGDYLVYVRGNNMRHGASTDLRQFNYKNESADKFYKVDLILDLRSGAMRTYVDGKLMKDNSDEPAGYVASKSKYETLSKFRFNLQGTSGTTDYISVKIDNVGYKLYDSSYTLSQVYGDVFGTPSVASFEVLSNSTKAQLNVLARGNGLNADGTAAGNMIIASYDGNRLTNVVYQPSSVGAECSATFTNDLANTDKIACFFFGGAGTAKEMQPLVDAKYIDYDNSLYAE